MEAKKSRPTLFIEKNGNGITDSKGMPVNFGEDVAQIKTIIPTVGDRVIIKESTIPNSGKGLFASRAFKKNEIVTFYDGAVSLKVIAKELMDCYQTHARKLGGGYTIYGNYTEEGEEIDLSRGDFSQVTGKGGGAFLNHGGKDNNCGWYDLFPPSHLEKKADPFQIVVLLYALRDIQKGEELFISYGDDYWAEAEKTGGKKRAPNFIMRDKYYREQREEAEREAARILQAKKKRFAPTLLTPEEVEEEKRKKQKVSTCIQCSASTSLVDVQLNVFFCREACRALYSQAK